MNLQVAQTLVNVANELKNTNGFSVKRNDGTQEYSIVLFDTSLSKSVFDELQTEIIMYLATELDHAYSEKTSIQKDILKRFSEDYNESPIEAFKNQVNAIKMATWKNDYEAIVYMVEGGTFLVYYDDITEYLNSLGINPENKEYSNEKSWELYKHLIAREGVKLLNKFNK